MTFYHPLLTGHYRPRPQKVNSDWNSHSSLASASFHRISFAEAWRFKIKSVALVSARTCQSLLFILVLLDYIKEQLIAVYQRISWRPVNPERVDMVACLRPLTCWTFVYHLGNSSE